MAFIGISSFLRGWKVSGSLGVSHRRLVSGPKRRAVSRRKTRSDGAKSSIAKLFVSFNWCQPGEFYFKSSGDGLRGFTISNRAGQIIVVYE